jgi:transposase
MARSTDMLATTITSSEAIDDIPLLIAHLKRLRLQELLDAHYRSWATPEELSLGGLIVLWLAHMLSQSKRQTRNLRQWSAAHPVTIRRYLDHSVHSTDISDARLHKALAALGDDGLWRAFEAALNRQLAQHPNLISERIRLNRLVGQMYITSEGMLQFEQGRRWWPGSIPIQMTICQHVPSGLPATVLTATSAEARAELSAETIIEARRALDSAPAVFLSDDDLGTDVRSLISDAGDCYVCILDGSLANAERERLQAAPMQPIFRHDAAGQLSHIADLYEYAHHFPSDAQHAPGLSERRVLVRSFQQLKQENAQLDERLRQAHNELASLNERKRGKRLPRTLTEMEQAAEAILDKHRVAGLLVVTFHETIDTRIVRRYRGRPTMPRAEHHLHVRVHLDSAQVERQRQELGWRVIATNMPAEQLSAESVLQLDLHMYTVTGRISNRPLSITAGIVQHPDLIRGLVRLLSLGLRAMALIDVALRHGALEVGLTQEASLESGARRGMAELMLETYKDMTLTVVNDGYQQRYHVTALSALQRRMLEILGLPVDIYSTQA